MFETFQALKSKFIQFLMSILKRQVNSSSDFSLFFIVITFNSALNFYLNFFFSFGQKNPMKVPILRLPCALVKICQIPLVIFQTTSQFFFKFCFTLKCHELYLFCTFLGQTLYTLHKRDQSKRKFFRLFSARIKIHQILVIFETRNLQILHHSSISRDITPLYIFRRNFIYFQQKEPIIVQIS